MENREIILVSMLVSYM